MQNRFVNPATGSRPPAHPSNEPAPSGHVGQLPTFGIEEEFLLVTESGRLSPKASSILKNAEEGPGALQSELHESQVESATGICQTPKEALEHLLGLRSRLARSANHHGLRLVPSGTAIVTEPNPPGTRPEARYRAITKRFGATAWSGPICGCHIHVEIPDKQTGIRVCNRVRQQLPVFLAITANSPYEGGLDTSYASWRYQQWLRWPSSGPPPHFESLAHYENLVDTMTRSGVILDRGMVYWDIRLSDSQPTLEFRVADVAAFAEEAVLLAVLIRALVTDAMESTDDGRENPPLSSEILRANLWCASRDGLAARFVDPQTNLVTPLNTELDRLLKQVSPILQRGNGDGEFVETQMAILREKGNGAQRQRAAFEKRHRLIDVVDLLSIHPDLGSEPVPANTADNHYRPNSRGQQ